MSDIYVKTSTGTSSTTWKKAVNLFVKTTTGTSAATWSAVKNVYVRFNAGWTRVWPLSGVFNLTSPYITTSSSSTTPLYGVDGVRRVGSTVWGKNGTWNANGWVINSYQYRWRAYSSSEIIDFNLASQTSLATYSGAISLSIPASYDRQYLSFFIQANSSGGTAYNGYAESAVEYGGLQIVRRQPINLTKSLSNLSPQVGNTISYSSSWDTSDAYAPEAFRTTIQWYRNLNNSTTGGTFITSGSYSYLVQSADLNHYIYAVETTYNSGTDYDLGSNVGVEAKVITTSTVVAGLTPPTSVSVSSVSRYSDTETLVTLSHSGGSGPYYQLYWVASSTTPVTASYDAASNTSSSSISEAFSFANNTTYYFYVRSSSENIATTFTNGTATAGTYSAYSNISPQPFYTFQSPTGGAISISGSSQVGGTLTLSIDTNPTASPAATGQTIVWRVNDGGAGGNSFTGGSILQNGGTSFVVPQFLYSNVSSVGYSVRAELNFNNGVGSQLAVSALRLITATLTKLATPTGVNASDNRSDGVNVTWNAVSGAAYYGVWYGPAPSYDSLADFGGNRNTSLITGTSYLDTSIGTNVTRDYYVQAYRSGDPTGTKSDWGGPNSGTRVAAATAPTGGSVSVNPTSGTAGSTTYTASASGWTGSGTISYTYSWQRFTNGLFQYEQLGTGTTFTPTVSQNSSALAWQVVVTASNGVSPNGTASASFTVSNPVTPTIPATPTGVSTSGSGLVSWSASSGATSYTVEWYAARNSTGTLGSPSVLGPFTNSTSSTSFQITYPSSGGNTYNWVRARVLASNSAGSSAYSGFSPSSGYV